jgi:tetratricopeptide (TPR) repeat protein
MATQGPTQMAIEVFYSYSHKDEKLRDRLETHLARLQRQGVITGWHDRKIGAGSEWKGAIDQRINTARVILLLISPDFIASDYCYNIEMRQAMQRHEAGEAKVIPIYLRPCDWEGTPFGKLQALPTDAKPVTRWKNRDEAFAIIAHGIRAMVEQLTENPASSFDASSYYKRGIEYLENGHYDLAIADFNQAIQIESSASGSWLEWDYYNRGLAYYFKNDFDSAIADWNRTIDLNSKNAWAYRQRGNAHLGKGDYTHAVSDYDRAIEIEPKVAKAYYNRGLLYKTLGEKDKATADFRKVLQLHNDSDTERTAKEQLAILSKR